MKQKAKTLTEGRGTLALFLNHRTTFRKPDASAKHTEFVKNDNNNNYKTKQITLDRKAIKLMPSVHQQPTLKIGEKKKIHASHRTRYNA